MKRSNEYCEMIGINGERILIKMDCIELVQENSCDNQTIIRMRTGEIETLEVPYEEFKSMLLRRL